MEQIQAMILDDTNYEEWFTQIKLILGAKELKDLVEIEGGDPELKSKYNKRNDHAKYIIYSSLQMKDKTYVKDVESAFMCIKRLNDLYGREECIYDLINEFNNLKWGTKHVEIFMSELDSIKNKIKSLDPTYKDETFISKIIDETPNFLRFTKEIVMRELRLNRIKNYEDVKKEIVISYKEAARSKDNKHYIQEKVKTQAKSFYTEFKRCYKCGSGYHVQKNCPDIDKPSLSRDNYVRKNYEIEGKGCEPSNEEFIKNEKFEDSSETRKNYKYKAKVFSLKLEESSDNSFYLDNGSTHHVSKDRRLFDEFEKFDSDLSSVNGGKSEGRGTIKVISRVKGVNHYFKLSDVLYIPNSPINIFSQIKAENEGMDFVNSKNETYRFCSGFYDGQKIVTSLRLKGSSDHYKTTIRSINEGKKYEFPVIESDIGMISFVTSDFNRMMKDIMQDFGLFYRGIIKDNKYIIYISVENKVEKKQKEITESEKGKSIQLEQSNSYIVIIGEEDNKVSFMVNQNNHTRKELKRIAREYYGHVKLATVDWDQIKYEKINF